MRILGTGLRLSASDVANFLACQHLTRLDLLAARRELKPPVPFDAGFQDLVKRGEVHEQAVLQDYRAAGLAIAEIASGPDVPDADAAQATLKAMCTGADVIYQGVLLGPPGRDDADGGNGPALLGRPDFLVRAGLLATPDGEPPADGEHYEIVDAKLARSAKGRAVAQIAFYTSLLTAAQGVRPRWMHLALGNGELASFKVSDYAAYERQTRRVLAGFIAADPGHNPPADPYPEPVEHCAICRWSQFCAARRRADDDLSLVAGITADQRRALKAAGVATRREFAEQRDLSEVRAGQPALERAQRQAWLQVASQDAGRIEYELLDPERNGAELVPNRGLLALPDPVPGDLFFDIEGARYYSEDGREFGLQYLFGIVDTADPDASGAPRYTQLWAFDRRGEKEAFEELIDFITERRARHPGLHVYHYNHYEPTSIDHLTELHETRQEAVGRLMGRFATREDEVDNLFRLGVFVDLYRVVRQGVRAGVESYSIKRLEPLCGYQRQVELPEATSNLIAFENALEYGTAEAADGERAVVAGYNEDDCRATLALRDWLERCRAELATRLGQELPRPVPPEAKPAEGDPELARLRAALLAGVPADAAQRTDRQRASALLADLLDWHRREARPGWWRYFYLRTLTDDELIGEPDALGGLTRGDVVGHVRRSEVRRFSFPPQEHKFTAGDTAPDPATGKGWPIAAVDDEQGTIDLTVGVGYTGPVPTALIEAGPIDTAVLAGRLRELGDRVARYGADGRDAATALLRRLPPATDDEAIDGNQDSDRPLRRDGETASQAAIRLATRLRRSYLPIQGPPGAGKTYTAAEQILELTSLGRTVGITGPSHAVIANLIGQVTERATARGARPRIGQHPDPGQRHLAPGAQSMTYDQLERALVTGELDVAAGTAWMWARPQFAGSVDTLFVDEAGQLSLANVLAVAGAARNLVLVGDPQQLAQPSQAAHPPGAGASALEHVLGEHATMPAAAGLLIDITWRMHPRLCRYTSETFYDGKLTGVDGLELQEVLGQGTPHGAGLRVVTVPHEGNTSSSPEEAERVARLVAELTGRQWRDRYGLTHPLGPDQILVVTPYNAQVRAIEEALGQAGAATGVRVGTVDKFQGREAAVAIYSMATSSAVQAPRGLEFLYDNRRLNVATSRARALAIIVASPDLVRAPCRTPRQMALVNALCQAWDTGA
jgi:predicted RecB family nuclease